MCIIRCLLYTWIVQKDDMLKMLNFDVDVSNDISFYETRILRTLKLEAKRSYRIWNTWIIIRTCKSNVNVYVIRINVVLWANVQCQSKNVTCFGHNRDFCYLPLNAIRYKFLNTNSSFTRYLATPAKEYGKMKPPRLVHRYWYAYKTYDLAPNSKRLVWMLFSD